MFDDALKIYDYRASSRKTNSEECMEKDVKETAVT
jgi:hypothetical protein